MERLPESLIEVIDLPADYPGLKAGGEDPMNALALICEGRGVRAVVV
jgi:hypothetical protein